ncbi:sporulation histidine kinase inhibitor Sda [Neobacillus sp. PS3-12]|nr:sporulation histidine kinase inhibitor Sda [Neobacillus sp. PS3-12]WML53076.1 sporulation histidine kinase inhibitor Sda [Neobacillus sp. PS3-12]
MESLQILQDSLLIIAYQNAIKLNLSKDFINLLLIEIEKRNLLINETA